MFREHRSRFLDQLRERHAAAVVATARPKIRNHDCEYRFRPDSDFWYLTGLAEPEAVLVLLPAGPGPSEGEGEREGDRSHLFLRPRDREMEIWNGRRLGVEAAPEALGVDEAHPIEELWEQLPGLLAGYERIVYRLGNDEELDRSMIDCLGTLRGRARKNVRPPVEIIDHVPLLHELRLFKDERELALMRRGAAISAEAHLAAMAKTAPGVGEHEIDALLEATFRARGGTGASYTNIVAGGPNACILHYVENDAILRDGDLLLIDAGCEYQYYASDVTRTFPVNGAFSPEQRAIYEVVLAAQKAGVEHVRPGIPFQSLHDLVSLRVTEGLVALGLLEGEPEALVESGAFRRFFMHGTGHWLGLDVHDCGAYAAADGSRLLEPGMVFTIEPGIYVSPDDEEVEQRWRGIGVRIEDDILVTANGRENLTGAIPKEVDEVEAACRGAVLEVARP